MTMEEKCPIWGTKTLIGGGGTFNSPRAGGLYRIFEELLYLDLHDLLKDDEERVKMTDWLIEQREAGEKYPEITRKRVEYVKSRRKKAMSERIKSLMLFLAKEYEVGRAIEYGEYNQMFLKAYSSSLTKDEMQACLDYCDEKKYLNSEICTSYAMTVEGKIYAEEISRIDKQKRQCFVAMWFDENKAGMEDVYEKAIKPAIIDAGYDPCRVDEKPDLGKLDDQIIAEIKQSRFMIADFTSEKPKEPRGGVYYEAGFAYGLGLKVIPTCRKDFMKHIHFDTRQLRHIVWDKKDLQDFYESIYVSIGANIGWSEDAKGKGASFAGYKP